jgi:signal transduction histidine kinase/DNA-binding NarL/FixJ family response regulator
VKKDTPLVDQSAFDTRRGELIRRRARAFVMLSCALWVPLSLFTDGLTFGSVARGLWLRVPTGLAMISLGLWLRRPRPRARVEVAVTIVFTFVLASFGPALQFCTEENLLPVVLSSVIGAMGAATGLALSWRATATHCLVVNSAMLVGGLLREPRPGQIFFLVVALSFVMYPVVVFAAASRDRWQRGEWRAQQDLLEANERLQREETMRSRLFANLSHDLRTPLGVVRAEMELLGRLALPELGPSLDRVEANVGNAVDLLDQLLELARLSVAKAPWAPATCDLAPIAREVARRLQPSGPGLRVVVTAPSAPVLAHADHAHVRRIVANLVANAVRHVDPHHGTVEVVLGTSSADNGATPFVEIIDDGPGLSVATRAQLFERFGSFDRQGGTGSGIGLALARELAQLNEGRLDLVDGAARTTFRLSLPAATSAAQPEPVTVAVDAPARDPRVDAGMTVARPEGPPTGAGTSPTLPRVLLVEDNDDLRRATTRLLSRWFEVEPVATLGAALAAVSLGSPAAIVADIMLPDGDGYELLAAIRHGHRRAHLPFLLISALAEPAERIRGLEAGADDYVVKPFSGDELAARIKSAIGRASERSAALERQREDLLMELHDGVCGTLTHAALLLSTSSSGVVTDARDEKIAHAVRKGLSEARSLLDVLGTKGQSWTELVGSLRWQLTDSATRAGLSLEFSSESASEGLEVDSAVGHALRRIAAEALTNTLKHGSAARLLVVLEARDGLLRFLAIDDSVGTTGAITEGRGLSIVRRRVARFGGGASFGRLNDGGFQFEAWLRASGPESPRL